jgi:hypothetical protein
MREARLALPWSCKRWLMGTLQFWSVKNHARDCRVIKNTLSLIRFTPRLPSSRRFAFHADLFLSIGWFSRMEYRPKLYFSSKYLLGLMWMLSAVYQLGHKVLYCMKAKHGIVVWRCQAKQAKVLTGGGDLREAQLDVPLSVSHSCVWPHRWAL